MSTTVAAALAAMLLAGDSGSGGTPDQATSFEARLEGFREVPPISTPASGEFTARLTGEGESVQIEYELTYRGLTTPTLAAHVHFAQRGVNGAVSAFLCGGGDKPACPAEGTVTGTIDGPDVVGPEARGIAAGELEELLAAMQRGVTYVNVHSEQYPDGEIRGQIKRQREGQ